MRKHLIKAGGLSLLTIVATMVFAVVGARAEELGGAAGSIRILGAEPVGGEVATGEQVGQGTVLVPGLNIELVCQKVDLLNGKVINKTVGLGEFLALECAYWGTKTVNHAGGVVLLDLTSKLPCEILEEATLAKGSIIAKLNVVPILHEKGAYALVSPDGSIIAGILISTPSECPLPKLVSMTGSTVFKITLGDLAAGQPEETEVSLESSKAIAKLFLDKLFFGAYEAYVDAKAVARLGGAQLGCKWGVI